MTRTLLVNLVTLGDPRKLTGGYLYHRRLADLAAPHAARLDFVSVRERVFPRAILDGRAVARRRSCASATGSNARASSTCSKRSPGSTTPRPRCTWSVTPQPSLRTDNGCGRALAGRT